MTKTESYWWQGEHHRVPTRDNQKAKLYRAEREAFGSAWRKSVGNFQATIAFVRHVESTKTWKKVLAWSKQTPVTLTVKDGRGTRFARGGRYSLNLPVWARTAPVILHEMAHAATRRGLHNWPFAAAYLALVGRFIGAEARDKLKAAFKKHRVRFAPPRKFSAEHMAKLRAQGHKLAAARRKEKEGQ